ncbi:unnamed protein product [Macrosiphum euphorbiae]|uniref:Uncharacterized protein n=1 Tax=Macrosiphum euphorbiae TaxID=13131 RepID=A0AAV0W031_9HEMI|nr:unnamed protein product [Macrosiphum euphorbiae]
MDELRNCATQKRRQHAAINVTCKRSSAAAASRRLNERSGSHRFADRGRPAGPRIAHTPPRTSLPPPAAKAAADVPGRCVVAAVVVGSYPLPWSRGIIGRVPTHNIPYALCAAAGRGAIFPRGVCGFFADSPRRRAAFHRKPRCDDDLNNNNFVNLFFVFEVFQQLLGAYVMLKWL